MERNAKQRKGLKYIDLTVHSSLLKYVKVVQVTKHNITVTHTRTHIYIYIYI